MVSNSTNGSKYHFNTDVNAQIALTFSVISGLGLSLLVIITLCYWKCQKKLEESCLNPSQCSTIIFIAVGMLSMLSIVFLQDKKYYSGLLILLIVKLYVSDDTAIFR